MPKMIRTRCPNCNWLQVATDEVLDCEECGETFKAEVEEDNDD